MKTPNGLRVFQKTTLIMMATLLQHCCSPKTQLASPEKLTPAHTTPLESTNSSSTPKQESTMESSNPASRQLLVAFTVTPSVETRSSLWKKYELREIEQVSAQALFLVEAPRGTGAEDLKKIQKALSQESGVRYAEPNIQMRIFKNK